MLSGRPLPGSQTSFRAPMPIYAYKCESCGHRKDVLQKMSDPLLTDCPACGASSFVKQVTAAGFQLKGSGWYVTDFRDGGGKKGSAEKDGDKAAETPADKKAEQGGTAAAEAKPVPAAEGPAAKTAAAPTPAPAPAAPSA
jgi:putative FmdB family regulatory protein